MAQAEKDSGFALPQPKEGAPEVQGSTASAVQPDLSSTAAATDTSSRDLIVGGGFLAVLLVAFFFAKNGYANSLVARRVSPGKANTAGWWMFALLSSLATGVVLAVINPERYLTLFIMGSVGIVALISLAQMLRSSRK